MEMKDAKEQVTRVTRDAKSTLESTVTKYLLTVDFLGQAWTCSGIACMRHTCDLGTQEVRHSVLLSIKSHLMLAV